MSDELVTMIVYGFYGNEYVVKMPSRLKAVYVVYSGFSGTLKPIFFSQWEMANTARTKYYSDKPLHVLTKFEPTDSRIPQYTIVE